MARDENQEAMARDECYELNLTNKKIACRCPDGSIAMQARDENRDASARPLPMDEGSRRWVRVADSTKMRDIQKQCLQEKLIPWLTWHIQIWRVMNFLASLVKRLRF
jgi:hypothetical protein